MWVRHPNLPRELWNEDVFEGVGKVLGGFIGVFKSTWDFESLSYARLCVYLQVDTPLPTQIKVNLPFMNTMYLLKIDYENIPF